MPTGEIVYSSDRDENIQRISTVGRAFMAESFSRIKNHSPINVVSSSGGSEFESVAVGKVYLRSESGNNIMWWGGTGDDSPYSGHGMPLWGGETTPLIPVTNFNTIRICSAISGQVIYALGFLNGDDTTLSNTSPTYPDTTAPFVISHSPVSGISGVALNSDITVTFSETINPNSLTSGVFSLSPVHNVTFYRDTTDLSKIVLSPNQNMSGATVYNAVVTTAITDLYGNRLSGQLTFPFTTVSGAPPPDTTPPIISGIVPVSGSTSVDSSTSPTVTFSEKMLSGTINGINIFMASISGATSGNVDTTITLNSSDQKTVTIDPVSNLDIGAVYYINVTTGVQDLAGNAMASATSNHPFTTTYNFIEVFNVTGNDVNDIGESTDDRIGLKITSNNSELKGSIVKKVVMSLKDGSSPAPTGTATVNIGHFDGSSRSVIFTMGTFNASILTGSYQDITITNLNNTHVMVDDDVILLEYTGPGKIDVRRTTTNQYTGTNYIERNSDGTYDVDTAMDIGWKVYK